MDAIVVTNGEGRKVFTLEGADYPYRALVENIREGALTLSRDGTILYANGRFAAMVKIPADKVAGTSIVDHVCPENRVEIQKALHGITKRASSARVRISQGKVSLPVLISMNPLSDDENTKISAVVTDRRKDEQEIQDLLTEVQHDKDRLSSLVNSISDEIWFADTEKKFTLANPAALQEFALEYGETNIEKFAASLEVLRPDGTSRAEEAPPLRALRGEVVKNQEEIIRTPMRGKLRYRQVSSNPVRDASGAIIGSVSVVRDITDREQTDDALRDSEVRYRTLVDSSPDGVIVHRDGTFLYANAVALGLYGASSLENFAGKTVSDLIVPDDRPQIAARVQRAMGGEPIPLRETVLLKLDGTPVTVESVGGPVLYGGERAVQIIIRDITLRKEAEEALRKNETTLREALAEKEILLSEIHHRSKNNLTAFISLLSLEGSYVDTPEGQALKKDLQNRARTMALIHETLYKTRQYSNVDMEVYLSTLVDQVVNSYSSTQSIRAVVDAKGVTLDLNRATPIGLIINELVTNSLKYAFPMDAITCLADRKEPCNIGIRLMKEDGTYLLKISDNGIGLPDGLDIKKTKTLGLKLVNFLASHQASGKT